MEVTLLDANFKRLHILDSFKSFIWTDRFWTCGDFDISISPSPSVLSNLTDVVYLGLDLSDKKMILEDINISSDHEDGDLLILKGRSLESILDRRIVWESTSLSGDFQDEVERLMDENVINPTDSDRDLSVSFITNSVTDITDLTIDSQFYGERIYDVICELCETKGIGWRLLWDVDDSEFQFKLLAGVDRSYGQSDVQAVAFTADLDNLIGADYVETARFEKTVVLTAGEEGVGNTRQTVVVEAPGGGLTGLARKELYFEASVTKNPPSGELTDQEYLDQLAGMGEEELAKNVYVEAFDGEVDTTMYSYGDDFTLGDILQIADQYGHETESRVIEMIYSQDANGTKIYPTFSGVE